MNAVPLLLAWVMLSSAAGAAQEPDWSRAERVEITLSNFRYDPGTLTLEHGRPYLLHLANRAGGSHDFVARNFFAAATLAPDTRTVVRDGRVELKGGETADLRLIAPPPGSYEVHCSHFMHSAFGMKGRITVR